MCNIAHNTLKYVAAVSRKRILEICCKYGEKCQQNALIFTCIHLMLLADLLITSVSCCYEIFFEKANYL